jgi:hypothetical protein
MTYEQFKRLKPSDFKRRCGVHPETFGQMTEILRPNLDRQGKRGGQCKLSVENQLLLVLEYWRVASYSVPHCHQLGAEGAGSMSAYPKSGKLVDGFRQISPTR